jgi:hypothetical protein
LGRGSPDNGVRHASPTAEQHAKAFLAGRGIDIAGEQQTKTRTALEFFASQMT